MNYDIIFYSVSIIAIIGVLLTLIGLTFIAKDSRAKIGGILTVVGLSAVGMYIVTMLIMYISDYNIVA